MVDIANTILGTIVDRKKEEFAVRLKQRSYKDVEELASGASPVRGFAQSLLGKRPAVIAEIKKASPSKELFVKALILRKLHNNMKMQALHVYLF